MAFGQIQKSYVSAVNFLDRRDILNQVLDVTNEESTFMDIMELMKREAPTDTIKYDHFVNEEMYQVETINGVPTGTGAAPSIVLANVSGASSVREGSLILAPNGEVGLVVGFTADAGGDQVDIESVDGTSLALANTNKIAVFSNAYGEGSSEPSAIRYNLTKRYNQVQTFKTAVQLTDIELRNKIEVEFEGKPYYMYKASFDGILKHRADIMNAIMWGRQSTTLFSDSSPSLADSSGNAVQTTMGINQYCEDYGIGNTSVTIGFTHYATQARQMAAARCPDTYWLFEGTEGCIAHDNFLKNLGSADTEPGRYSLDTVKLDFGSVQRFNLYGFNYMRKKLPILDHKNLVNFTGSSDYHKRIYFLPEGKQKTHAAGGAMADRFRIRYMEHANPVNGTGKYKEYFLGSEAPTPTSGENILKIVHESRIGFEALGADFFVYAELS